MQHLGHYNTFSGQIGMYCVHNAQKRALADNDLSRNGEFESSRRVKIGEISEHHVANSGITEILQLPNLGREHLLSQH